MTRSKAKDGGRPGTNKTLLLAFAELGEYPLHTRVIHKEDLGAARPIPCAIRDSEELSRERLEIHCGEELHTRDSTGVERPLLRYDQNGVWAWIPAQGLWFPLRNQSVVLDLDHTGKVRLRFTMVNQ